MAMLVEGVRSPSKSSGEHRSPAKNPFLTTIDCSQENVLLEGEFNELNDQLWIDKHVKILVTSEYLYLTEKGSKYQIKKQSNVLQPDPTKTVFKYDRSDIEYELLEGCLYTFKAKWRSDECWKTYRLCGQVSEQEWVKWIRCFKLWPSASDISVPMASPESVNTDISSSDDEEDDGEVEEVSLPNCLPLCVDRAMSMLSMTMLNPSNVRKMAFLNLHDRNQKRASLGTIGSENEDVFETEEAGSLFPSTSYPRLSFTKPFCTFSLMNISDLENVNLDNDLKSKKGETHSFDQDLVQQIKSKSFSKPRRGSKFQNITATEVTLQNRIEHLRAHPSNLNFVRRHLWDEKTLSVPSACHNRRLSLSLALTSDSNRIPQSTEHLGLNPAKRALQRAESSPARSLYLPNPKHTATPIIKTPVARRLNFKDDMAIDITNADQKPQKAKVRRFLTILQKKRTRNHPPLPEIPFSPTKDLSNRVDNSPSKLRRVKSFSAGSTRRWRRSEEVGYGKDARKEGASLNVLPLQTSSPHRQDSVNESPFSRKGSSSSSSGSVRKKFVQRILSPILKSSSFDDYEVGRSLSPTETPFSPDLGDALLNGWPRGLVDIDAVKFAKEITLIDKELFVRILWHELESCGWMTKDKYVRSPNVMEMVEFFNRVALLVATEILAEETPQARARVISKVIQIADKCRLLGNFNSLKALMAGLQSTPLYRMKETWKEVSSKRKKKFRDLSILMGESDNFALYRKEMASCLASGPCLPFFGDFLTQIAQSQTFMSVKRKRQKTAKEVQPDETVDGTPVNGVTTCNGVTSRSHNEPSSCPTTPREFSPDTSCDLINESRETTVTCSLHDIFLRDRPKRSSGRMKLPRFHSRQNSTEDSSSYHNRNNSAELLDVHRFKSKLMPASSDSVISNSNSSNGHYGNNPRTPLSGKPPLLRRLSESSSSSFFSGGAFSGKPKRRLSESSKTPKTRRFFLDGLVRRSTSSNSVKDGRVNRGMNNEVLGHSFSTQSIREGSVTSHEVLGKSVSTPLIKDGCNILSRDISRDPSRDCSFERLESDSTFDEERWQSLVRSSESTIAGTELQLIKYQMSTVQYDFVSSPEVRQFLLNASFNTEEENYRLSLKREPAVKTT